MRKRKQTTIRLTDDLEARLDAEAKKTDLKRQRIMEKALEAYLPRLRRKRKGA